MSSKVFATISGVALSGLALAGQRVVDFEGGLNEGNWSMGTGGEAIARDGGNGGAFLRDPTLISAIPRVQTGWMEDSAFTGD